MALCAQNSVTKTLGVALTHVVQVATELVSLNDRCQQGVLTLLSELLLQNGNTVEVILESALVTAGNHQNVVQTGTDCFLHHVLNRGAIDDGEHFLGGCLRCGQESGAQTSSRNNCLSNRLNFSSHGTRIP